MIFQLTFADKTEFANAKDELHLLQEYYREYGDDDFLEIEKVDVISDEQAKTIMLKCDEPEEVEFLSLYSQSSNDGVFNIIGSSEWV